MVREPTEADYQASERTSDRLVGLWLLTIVGCACVAGIVSAVTKLNPYVVSLVVFVPSLVGYGRWAQRRAAHLLPQRQAVRPVRVGWIAKRLAIGTCAVVVA